MNWTHVEGQWRRLRGQVKSNWARLSDADIAIVAGERKMLVAKLRERYRMLTSDAETEIDDWLAALSPKPWSNAGHSLSEGKGPNSISDGSLVPPAPPRPRRTVLLRPLRKCAITSLLHPDSHELIVSDLPMPRAKAAQ